MKKILLGLALITLTSCSNESKMKSGIKDYLDKNAKDPKSYELVELTNVESLILGDVAKKVVSEYNMKIQDDKKGLEVSKNNLKEALKFKDKYKDNVFDEDIASTKNIIKEAELGILSNNKEIERYSKVINSKNVIGYKAHHKYRLKNGFGALDLTENDVLFDEDYKIINFDARDDIGEFLLRQATK
ncbi:hypothetical protein JE952_002011 [Flavobacterium psychrophilum]|nr:hypothetical protein [Flavobacterium psychrophilum]EKT4508348.1 hypothetical protein [Flavobacterium psychrophilum]EKT4545541.1 hypothetical protein [Flavobacterium psychrophilum]EKT4550369.1 hypothetical protein [Flavobacterium psychrophilum]